MDYELDQIFCSYELEGKQHSYVDEELALAHLFLSGVLMCNNGQGADGQTTCVYVICNDVFAWACADAQNLPTEEIGALFRLWHTDKIWGPAKWCAIRRNQKPQPPVIKAMQEEGAWDDVMERLPENTQDAETQAMFYAAVHREARV